MRKVLLVFPDVSSITEFVLSYKVSKALVNTSEKTLKAILADKHLGIAVKQFGAKIKESIPIKSPRS